MADPEVPELPELTIDNEDEQRLKLMDALDHYIRHMTELKVCIGNGEFDLHAFGSLNCMSLGFANMQRAVAIYGMQHLGPDAEGGGLGFFQS